MAKKHELLKRVKLLEKKIAIKTEPHVIICLKIRVCPTESISNQA